jgi:transcriptional regulator with XRE-family HTH domain
MYNPRSASLTDKLVGARLLQFRHKSGLNQGELAERVGVSWQQISKYETGINRLSVGRLCELAKALGATPQDFFEGLSL